jgi:putative DNA primase/helicase
MSNVFEIPVPKKLELSKAILDFQTLLNTEIPERKKILPWLPEGGLAMVFGQRGLGKTYFGLSLAMSVSQGTSFMKWPISEPGGVLYVDGEMWLGDIRERLKKFTHTSSQRMLQILSHELFFQQFECDLTITQEEVQEALLTLLDASNDIQLVVIDNLSSLSRIREDKSDDWRHQMLPFLIACRRRGVAVLMVHHAGKGGEQRGTGAREDHLDTSIKLSLPDEANPNDGCYFRVDFTKSRGCYGQDIEPFTAKLQENPYGETEWTIASIEENDKQRLIRLIADCGDEGISAKEACEELGLKKQYVSRYRKQLEDEGVIQYAMDRKKPMKISLNWEGGK